MRLVLSTSGTNVYSSILLNYWSGMKLRVAELFLGWFDTDLHLCRLPGDQSTCLPYGVVSESNGNGRHYPIKRRRRLAYGDHLTKLNRG